MISIQEPVDILESLARSVVELSRDRSVTEAKKALADGVPALDAISLGLAEGMRRVGKLFSDGEYFVPEVLVAARALYAGLEILRPHLPARAESVRPEAVIGVVQGDVHDIGKNIVKIFWEANGFRVEDLGKNVPIARFLNTIEETETPAVALSTLMTSTLHVMEETVANVHRQFDCAGVKILVGGASVSPDFARDIGADFYGRDGSHAVEGLKSVLDQGK